MAVCAEDVPKAESGPELPDAAGHTVGVIIQLHIAAQRHHVLRTGLRETLQIEFLTTHDHRKHVPNQLAVLHPGPLKNSKCFREAGQQLSLRGVRLAPGKFAEIRQPGSRPSNALTHSPQSLESTLKRDQCSVSDCVCCARQQVGEAELGPDCAWQHAQRQIERTRNVLQQSGQQRS